jgi:hypothetical protein
MPVPFAPGNQLAVHRRTVENALRRAAHRSPLKLDRACDRLIDSAAEGESWQERIAAFSLLADRLDGRARQSLDITGDGAPRELALADVVQAVLAARASSAVDAPMIESASTPQVLDSSTLPAAEPALPGVGPDPSP